MGNIIPTEDDLHAYLDGELPAERHAAVAEYLSRNADDARRLQAYRTDGEAIAKIFGNADQLRRPIPSATSARSVLPFRLTSGFKIWQVATALTLVVLAAGLGLFWQHGNTDARGNRLAVEAAKAHPLVANAAPSADAPLDEIARFLSANLAAPVKLRRPEGGDYSLVANRLLTTPRGRVAQLVFRGPDQTIVTMYLEPWPGTKDTPFHAVDTGRRDVTTLFWTDDEVACAVTGALPPDRLEQIARSLYEAVFS